MQEKGINLLDQAFEQVTDEQIAAFHLNSGQQRMDSVLLGSNIRQRGRLQLLVEVMQRVQRIQRYLKAPNMREASPATAPGGQNGTEAEGLGAFLALFSAVWKRLTGHLQLAQPDLAC
jgi:hypothetical protein